MTACGLAFAIVAFATRRSIANDRPVMAVGVAVCVLVCPFIVIEGPWASSMPFMLVLAAVDGAAFVWLCALWGTFYVRLSVRQAFACVCGFLIVSSVTKVFLDLLGHDIVGTVLLAATALVSVACWRVAMQGRLDDGSEGGQSNNDAGLPAEQPFDRSNLWVMRGTVVAFFIIVTGVALCMSLTGGVFGLPFGYRVASQVATTAISAGALYASYRAWGSFSSFRLWYLAVLVIASGLAIGVIVGAPLGRLSSAIFTTAQMLSIGFVWLACSDVAHRGREASDLVFCGGWALCFSAPMAVGLALPHALPSMLDERSLAVVVIWLLLLALVFVDQRQSPELRLFANFTPQVSADDMAQLGGSLDRLAADYGLTPREREVIELYAQGRSRSFISTQLVISDNTVRDHIKNVYKKLGIHNKQELIDLIE